MRAAKVQASLRIRAVSPEPPLLAHTSIESRGTFRQKARSLAPLNGWACAVKICHDGMLEDTNSLDGAHMAQLHSSCFRMVTANFSGVQTFSCHSFIRELTATSQDFSSLEIAIKMLTINNYRSSQMHVHIIIPLFLENRKSIP